MSGKSKSGVIWSKQMQVAKLKTAMTQIDAASIQVESSQTKRVKQVGVAEKYFLYVSLYALK